MEYIFPIKLFYKLSVTKVVYITAKRNCSLNSRFRLCGKHNE